MVFDIAADKEEVGRRAVEWHMNEICEASQEIVPSRAGPGKGTQGGAGCENVVEAEREEERQTSDCGGPCTQNP